MKYFLGIEIFQFANVIFFCQQKYVTDIIQKFRMANCKPVDTTISQGNILSNEDISPLVDPTLYKSLVGSLLCLTATRHDIMFEASFVSRVMQSPKITH